MEKWNKNCSLKMRYSPRGEIFGTNHGSGSIDIDFKATNLTLFYKNNVNLEFMCRYSTKSLEVIIQNLQELHSQS